MNLKQKLQYIWDYYKLPIFAVPIALFMVVFLVKSLSTDTEPALSLYLINQPVTIEECESLKETLNGVLFSPDAVTNTSADPSAGRQSDDNRIKSTQNIYIDASLIITPDSPDYDSQTAFTTAIAGHTIDVMIGDQQFLDYYAAKGAFYDLSELLPEDLNTALSPLFLKAADYKGTERIYGIDVSNCPLFADLGLNQPILTVAKFSEHTDTVLALLRALATE